MDINKFFKGKEVRVTFLKVGKVFNPTFQKRTDAMDDLATTARKKDKASLDKVFNITEDPYVEKNNR